MSYWCDDQRLNLEQRRLDAERAERREKAGWDQEKRDGFARIFQRIEASAERRALSRTDTKEG